MNSLRHDLDDLPDVPVDLPPPPPPVERGGGGGGGVPVPRAPRITVRAWLPWLLLGMFLLAAERLTLMALTTRALPPAAYVAAAGMFVGLVVAGVAVGGTWFHRAWHADRQR